MPAEKLQGRAGNTRGEAVTARPKVEVRATPSLHGSFARFVGWCHEPGCTWVYVNGVKTDVQEMAKYHRAQHRNDGAAGGGR